MWAVAERIRGEWEIGFTLYKTKEEAEQEAVKILVERYGRNLKKLSQVLHEFVEYEGHWTNEKDNDDYSIDIDEIEFGKPHIF